MDDFLKTNGLLFLLGVTLMLITLQLFRTWLRLRHIPGPFLASLTNFQRVWWVKTKRAHLIHEQIHNEYGEIVRIGPNMVSISNPEAIPTVYPIRPGFIKSDFYAALRPYTRGGGALQAVFNIQDEKLHKQMKSPIAPIFSVTSVTSFESLVDKVLKCMSENLDRRFVKSTNVFDLGEWLQFFAFDVMGTMTFSKSYGFLDQGKDVGGMLATIFKYMQNVAAMTQIPWLDKIMYKNGFADSFRRTPGLSILKFVGEAITERQEKMAQGDLKATDSLESKKDFLTRFIELHSCNPEIPRW
ncbi:hypothetical protein MMC17_009508 [Xylographa soralifera]|nr:hypothetical protein [Xylographa soralifera]